MCNRAARPWRALVWRAHHSACAMCESLTRCAQSAPLLTSRAVLWPPACDQRRGPSTPRHATHGLCGRIGATRRRYSARDHLAQRSVRVSHTHQACHACSSFRHAYVARAPMVLPVGRGTSARRGRGSFLIAAQRARSYAALRANGARSERMTCPLCARLGTCVRVRVVTSL